MLLDFIMLSILNFLHVLSVVIWLGGMLFAHKFLRPAAAELLDPPERLTLWAAVFKRFFPYVWLSVILLPLTGYAMIFSIWGSLENTPIYVHVMNGLGMLMIAIYLYVYFVSFKHLRLAVENKIWPNGGKALMQIRSLVGINTLIGIAVVLVAAGGRFFI